MITDIYMIGPILNPTTFSVRNKSYLFLSIRENFLVYPQFTKVGRVSHAVKVKYIKDNDRRTEKTKHEHTITITIVILN